MNIIKQRFNNDCVIACVAMIAGVTYDEVFFRAVERGFVPDNGEGLQIWQTLEHMGFDCDWCDGGHGLFEPVARIVSVYSQTRDDLLHAVVVKAGHVFDPQGAFPYGIKYVMDNVTHTFFDFEPL